MTASVLVVEDEPSIQELVAVSLARHGHEVKRAANAEEAYRAVAETLPDPGFSVWLTKGSPGAAGGELGAKLDAVLASVSGTPVKRVSATSVAFDGGKPVATTTTVEVIRLRREKIPASTFAPPLDCTNRTGQER